MCSVCVWDVELIASALACPIYRNAHEDEPIGNELTRTGSNLCCRFEFAGQSPHTERRMRPPSSGKPGIMLKAANVRFTVPSQDPNAAAGLFGSASNNAGMPNTVDPNLRLPRAPRSRSKT